MKTVLDQNKLADRRRAAVASAFLLAAVMPLAACDNTPTYEPQEIADLNDHRESMLVEGREGCISALVDGGKSREEAEKMCDTATIDAVKSAQAQTPSSGSASGSWAGSNSSNSNSSSSNAFLWYLIGRNSAPAVYTGSPSTGFQSYGGGPASGLSGGGTATATATQQAAPARLSPTQAEYLRAPTLSARSSISARLAATPGTKMSSVRSLGFSTSRGGFSTGRGISMVG